MPSTNGAPRLDDAIEARIEAFEAAQRRDPPPEPDEFLPPAGHPLRPAALGELLRVDLELRWSRGQGRRLDEYLARYPELSADPAALAELAFEEYRQRGLAGERPEAAEYRERFGIRGDDWPALDDAGELRTLVQRVQPVGSRPEPGGELRSVSGEPIDPAALAELRRSAPGAVERLTAGVTEIPTAGQRFLGFELLSELGCGAFGRVFLARQPEVADRLVALKITVELDDEVKMLGQLQHTNIVPVYSVHRRGTLQALCMPYFGASTLAQVSRNLWHGASQPVSGLDLLTTLASPRGERGAKRLLSLRAPHAARRALPEPPPVVSSPVTREMLGRLSFVEAVLWLGARLADGLAHAHERGVLHRDLKPANILLTDDGQPMLLDFNLSAAAAPEAAGAIHIGGTLPYMAPEHLEAFRDGGTVGASSDLYSLGVLLYELLTGQAPHPVAPGSMVDKLEALLLARRQPAPGLRWFNSAISPATEAIVRKLLDPDPAQRYPSARALHEDLERQLAHKPLRYVREPSWFERLGKWRRRHPRWAAGLAAAAVAAALVVPTAMVLIQHDRAVRAAAADQWDQAQGQLNEALDYLTTRLHDPAHRAKGLELGRQLLARYRVADDPGWRGRGAVRFLSESEREKLPAEFRDLLLAMVRADQRDAEQRPASERKPVLREALAFVQLAESCADGPPPASLGQRRSELLKALGEAAPPPVPLSRTNVTDLDRLERAQDLAAAGQVSRALALFEEVIRNNAHNYAAWFGAGYCRFLLKRYDAARDCYTVCISLRPSSPWPYYHRGLALLRLGGVRQGRQRNDEARRAIADFTTALQLQPDLIEALINRALAYRDLKECAAAEQDLTAALASGTAPQRVYFLRADVRRLVGNKTGAEQDRALGLQQTPDDEASWVVRGLERANDKDFAGALADFDQALRLNPRSADALTDKAFVLEEKLGRTAAAIAVLDRLLEFYPDDLNARGSRGVYHARLGHAGPARRDARACYERDQSPFGLYQQAGIYALLSPKDPKARAEALRLLALALRRGFDDFEMLATDHDLGPLRGDPEFRRLVAAARSLQPQPAR